MMKGIMSAMVVLLCAGFALAAAAPDFDGIKDISVGMDSGPIVKFADLRNYVSDPAYSSDKMFFSIEKQSDTQLVDCFLQENYFISCNAPEPASAGMSTVTVRAQNPAGLGDSDEFNINVSESQPSKAITVSSDRNSVFLETGQSINVQLSVSNNSGKRECFTADAQIGNSERHEIEAQVPGNSFCLGNGERTSVTMTITAFPDARTDVYDVQAKFLYGEGSAIRQNIRAEVIDDDSPINIERLDGYFICRQPYTQEIKIRLENNSGRGQTISLGASHELLLPVFEFPATRLASGDEEEVGLSINTNYTTAFTDYTIPVFARSEDYFVEREIRIRVIECGKDEFDLTITPARKSMKRGEGKELSVILKSKIEQGQFVTLGVDGDIEARLDSSRVFLAGKGTKEVTLTVKAKDTEKFGKHEVKVTGRSAEETETKKAEIDIRDEHKLEMLIANNDFEARACSATAGQVFEVVLRNNGAFDEKARLSLKGVDASINATLTDKEITVKKGKEEKVYVFISPAFDAQLGNYTITLSAKSGSDEQSEELRFRVVAAETNAQAGGVEILSYPSEVRLASAEEKELSFTIKNVLAGALEDVRVRVYGSEEGAVILPISLGNIGPNQTRTFTRLVSASETDSDRVFNATLEVRAKGYASTKPIKITVAGKAAGQQGGGSALSGLAVLGSNGAFAAGVIILIVLVIAFIVLSLLNSNK